MNKIGGGGCIGDGWEGITDDWNGFVPIIPGI